ncbi:MAG: hypothetical protein Q7S25_01450, partial [Candidatus Limnocylindria bacterium]|nr:hypothetical protein [Candidatus Limnocylindria bacterium]
MGARASGSSADASKVETAGRKSSGERSGIRFALAVAAAAAAQVVVFLRVGDWLGVSAALALTYLMAAAAGAGFFAGRRAPLAGFLSVVCGALAYGIVAYATRDAEADLWSLV